ncbi:polysaccharide biosynthesis/export family protein [Salinicola avicenniae]|uniref:polysaccharide biosynthesis/export family protein n=1 Tax=Salinicola avicenniae TaxID=2916836 RepID=UPI0020738BE2|nr:MULTISPECIES: polysaccharide biosynthesis/export family protein [unclassified Salinicola]
MHKAHHRTRTMAWIVTAAMTLSGCQSAPTPENRDGALWMPQQWEADAYQRQCTPAMSPPPPAGKTYVPAAQMRAEPASLAPGDRLRVDVLGDPGDLSKLYVIDELGHLALPGLPVIDTTGRSVAEVEARLSDRLVEAQLVRRLPRVAAVSLVERAGISISVSGAVFNAGTVRIGERPVESRIGQRDGPVAGDANLGRNLSMAIMAAAGARPDANLGDVRVIRGDQWTTVDLAGLVEGSGADDLRLAPGDRIEVPSTHCFDAALVRPTPVTPPGVRVFMSNLSRPAASNASSAIGKESTSLPYGTRLLQGLVSANCVGGSAMNAHRHAVLISTNPFDDTTVVIDRDVEDMLERPDRDRINPYLMPRDALACYDSRWMNVRDAVSMVGEALGPAATVILIHDASP